MTLEVERNDLEEYKIAMKNIQFISIHDSCQCMHASVKIDFPI
jgi:hypothetical protein